MMLPSQGQLHRTHAYTSHCSQLLNEIMPLIYKRFTDKAAEEWRQIYKVWEGCDLITKCSSF